jgi:hypothetical protein
VTEFYSSADNLAGLIYENFWAIGFEQISGHSILTIWNITQNNFFSARSPVAICKLQVKPGKFPPRRANCNFLATCKKTKYTGMVS